MSDKKNIKINEKVIKGKGSDGKDTEIKIRTEEGKGYEINFDKDKKSTEKLKCEYKKKDGDKFEDKWTKFSSDVEWTGGIVFNGAKLKPENNKVSDVELKDDVKANLGFFKTPTIVSWIGIVIIIIGIAALIWWWIASSNKEDKEEESL